MKALSTDLCRGYIEGYYGQLPSWSMRSDIVRQLSALGLSSYFYAPKEDSYHRLHWREPYPSDWRAEFRAWSRVAHRHSIHIIAGLAPGLDFNFDHLNNGPDFLALVDKAQLLLSDGASAIGLLMDDINVEFNPTKTGPTTEGQAHALLANALSERIGRSIYVVPRVYAHELEFESPGYAERFSQQLNTGNIVFSCGTHIVAPSVIEQDLADYTYAGRHRVVVWDNLYANDYCPRRLFVGPWNGRSSVKEVMLNPTGMPATDALLLDIMANTTDDNKAVSACLEALKRHQIPDEFLTISGYFSHPFFVHFGKADTVSVTSLEQQLSAIECLLWKWKTPLSREWYPYLFGLKHDLLIYNDRLSELRIQKTQLSPLAMRLTR